MRFQVLMGGVWLGSGWPSSIINERHIHLFNLCLCEASNVLRPALSSYKSWCIIRGWHHKANSKGRRAGGIREQHNFCHSGHNQSREKSVSIHSLRKYIFIFIYFIVFLLHLEFVFPQRHNYLQLYLYYYY